VGNFAETLEGWRTLVVVISDGIIFTDATGTTTAMVLGPNGRFLQGPGADRHPVVTTLPLPCDTPSGSAHARVNDARI